jgi:membrane fusion protein (multidrug efflux system)
MAIDPRVDADSRSVAVRAELSNPEHALRPGQFVRISVVVSERAEALLVPEQAVLPRGNGSFVFRMVDGKAALTQVRIGQRQGGKAEILDGLTAADSVVTGGLQRLRDGAPVQPIEAGGVS